MKRIKLPAAERRAATVQAVVELASTLNPAEITTAQIAAHMGVTQGSLFRHFSDKHAIWAAVMTWTADELLGRLDAVTGATAIERLRAMFNAHIEFVVAYPGVPRILFGELQRDSAAPGKAKVLELMGAYRMRVVKLVDTASEQGLTFESVDSTAAATLLLGIVQGLTMQAMAADSFGAMPAMSARLFALYLDGLGVRA